MRENRATVRVVNSWLVVASYLSERTSTHPTSQGTIQVCCFMFQLCFLEFDGSLSGGTEGPMAYVKMLYWAGVYGRHGACSDLSKRVSLWLPHTACTSTVPTTSGRRVGGLHAWSGLAVRAKTDPLCQRDTKGRAVSVAVRGSVSWCGGGGGSVPSLFFIRVQAHSDAAVTSDAAFSLAVRRLKMP